MFYLPIHDYNYLIFSVYKQRNAVAIKRLCLTELAFDDKGYL